MFRIPALILCLLLAINGHAQLYVDDATGVNAAGYGTAAKPYKSISYAVQIAYFNSNKTILVKGGVYKETTPIVIRGRLTIRPWDTGAVVIDGSSLAQQFNTTLITLHNAHHVVLHDITIRNCVGTGRRAVYIYRDTTGNTICDSIIISHCRFNNIGWISNNLWESAPSPLLFAYAIQAEAHKPITNLQLIGNEVYNCATGWGQAISLKGNISNFIIDSNSVHNIANTGIMLMGNDGTAQDLLLDQPRDGMVRYNQVHDCGWDQRVVPALDVNGCYNVSVQYNKLFDNTVGLSIGADNINANVVGHHSVNNNLIYHNSVAGVLLGSATRFNTVTDVNVFNNTITCNTTARPVNTTTIIDNKTLDALAAEHGELCIYSVDGDTIMANILDAYTSKRCVMTAKDAVIKKLECNNNLLNADVLGALFYNGASEINNFPAPIRSFNDLSTLRNATGLEFNGRTGDPGFSNRGNWSLALIGTSAAIDIGVAYRPSRSGLTDFASASRQIGNSIDAGAYESPVVLPNDIANTTAQVLGTIYPNPTDDNTTNIRIKEAHTCITIVLTDITGKKVMDCYKGAAVAGQSIPVAFKTIPGGNYLLHLTADGLQSSIKLTVR